MLFLLLRQLFLTFQLRIFLAVLLIHVYVFFCQIVGVGLDIFMVAFYEYCTKLWYHHTFFIFNGF